MRLFREPCLIPKNPLTRLFRESSSQRSKFRKPLRSSRLCFDARRSSSHASASHLRGSPVTPSVTASPCHLPRRGRQGNNDNSLGSLFEGAVEQSETEGVVLLIISRGGFPSASSQRNKFRKPLRSSRLCFDARRSSSRKTRRCDFSGALFSKSPSASKVALRSRTQFVLLKSLSRTGFPCAGSPNLRHTWRLLFLE